jgi:tetratricopeptide (TPR) repeat protein
MAKKQRYQNILVPTIFTFLIVAMVSTGYADGLTTTDSLQDLNTASSTHNLAVCLDEEAQYFDAEIFLESSLEITEKVLDQKSLKNDLKSQRLLHPEALSAEEWFEIGNIDFDNGEFEDAVDSWHNAMYLDPELSANAWYNIGLAYAAAEKYTDAIEAWENAVAIQPDSAMAYDNLGTAYGIIGMVDKALEAYDMAIAIDPDEPKYKADRDNLIASMVSGGKSITKSITTSQGVFVQGVEEGT